MQISCTQCSARLELVEGESFAFCPHCDSSLFLDRSKIVFNYRLESTVDARSAEAALRAWMAGNDKVKHLDHEAEIVSRRFEHFPFWCFRRRLPSGIERVDLELAHSDANSVMRRVSVPAGDLKFLRPEDLQADSFVRPDISAESALQRPMDFEEIPTTPEVLELSLVFVPLHRFEYRHRDVVYSAVVDACSAGVYANLFPAKSETPYLLMGVASLVVFFTLGMLAGIDLTLKLWLYLAAAVPLLGVSFVVARKV